MSRRKKNGAKSHATDNVLRLVGGESVIKAANAQEIPESHPEDRQNDEPLSDAQMLYGKATATHRAQTYIQPTLPVDLDKPNNPAPAILLDGVNKPQSALPPPKPKPDRRKRVITDKSGQLRKKPEYFVRRAGENPLLTDVIPVKKAHPKPRAETPPEPKAPEAPKGSAEPEFTPSKPKHAHNQPDAEVYYHKPQGVEIQTVYVSAMLIMEQMGIIAKRYKNCECDICNRLLFFEGLGLMPVEFITAEDENGVYAVNLRMDQLRPLAIKALTKLCIFARGKPYHDRAQ
jgi:hypothetical protein